MWQDYWCSTCHVNILLTWQRRHVDVAANVAIWVTPSTDMTSVISYKILLSISFFIRLTVLNPKSKTRLSQYLKTWVNLKLTEIYMAWLDSAYTPHLIYWKYIYHGHSFQLWFVGRLTSIEQRALCIKQQANLEEYKT